MQNHFNKKALALCISLLVVSASYAGPTVAYTQEQIQEILAYDIARMSNQDKQSKAIEVYRLLINDKVDRGGIDLLSRLIELLETVPGWEAVTQDLKDILGEARAKNLAAAYKNAGGDNRFIDRIKQSAYWGQAQLQAASFGRRLTKHLGKLPKDLQREINCMNKITLTNILATKLLIG